MTTFRVTFEIVTEESAEHGEAAEMGFISEGCSLREAIGEIGDYAQEADSSPISLAHPPRWFTNCEFGHDYCTGERESRSLHLPRNTTPSSAIRVARLLGVRVS